MLSTELLENEDAAPSTGNAAPSTSSRRNSMRAKRRQSASNVLLHMLKQEMVSSMMTASSDVDDDDYDDHGPTKSDGTSPESEEVYYDDPDAYGDGAASVVSEQLSEFAEALFSSVDTKQAPQRPSQSQEVKDMLKAGMTTSKSTSTNAPNDHNIKDQSLKHQRKSSVSSTAQDTSMSMSDYDWIHDSSYNTDGAYHHLTASQELDLKNLPQNRKGSMDSSKKIQDLLIQFTEIALSSDSEDEEDEEEEEKEEDFDDDCSFISDITGFDSSGAVAFGHHSNSNNGSKNSGMSVSSRSHSSRSQVMIVNIPKAIQSGGGVLEARERLVRFHQVHIRYYQQIMSDNPSSSGGPSVGLGWEYRPSTKNNERTVDDFERERASQRKRGAHAMLISRPEREAMIHRWGYSQKEIAEMVRSVNRVRMQRRQTVNNRSVHKMEEAAEKLGRKFKKLLFASASKKK